MRKILFATILLMLAGAFAATAQEIAIAFDETKAPVRAIHPSVGSWVGRAVPANPPCPPGSILPDSTPCPVPFEITMLLQFFADGNFNAIDSNTFSSGEGELGGHSPAYGQWRQDGPLGLEATWLFLQERADNSFAGAFRMRMQAQSVDRDNMVGFVNAFFMPFTDETGRVILDDQGWLSPDPLQDLGPFLTDWADCDPAVGCFGVFEFEIRRIAVPPAVAD